MSYVAFKVPSRGALPPGSPHTAPIDRGAPFTERSFTVSQSSWKTNQPPSKFPNRTPTDRDALLDVPLCELNLLTPEMKF